MKCDDFKERVSFFIDNEMDRGEREGWESHLEGCDSCKKMLNMFKGIDSLIAGLPDPVPESLNPGDIISRGKRQRALSGLKLAGALSIMILLCLGAFIFSQRIDWQTAYRYTPIIFSKLDNKPAEHYSLALNESKYDLKIWGEEVKLLSCEISVCDGNTQAELSVDFEDKKSF